MPGSKPCSVRLNYESISIGQLEGVAQYLVCTRVTTRTALRNFCSFIHDISINTLRSVGKGKQDI